jgi:hypothetical protein
MLIFSIIGLAPRTLLLSLGLHRRGMILHTYR